MNKNNIIYKFILEKDLENYSFYQDKLNPKIWNEDKEMKENVLKKLRKIANDFIDNLGFEIDVDNIIMVGSMANYNWNKYSDIDLHILTDIEELSNNENLNKVAVKQIKTNWNIRHNIDIHGYEVEIYIQDSEEENKSGGVYSIKNDEWIKEPEYDEELDKNVEQKQKDVNELFKKYSGKIEELTDVDIEELDENEMKDLKEISNNLFKEIVNLRKEGLQTEDGEFSVGNLTFKKLRNSGDINEIVSFKKKLNDKLKSI